MVVCHLWSHLPEVTVLIFRHIDHCLVGRSVMALLIFSTLTSEKRCGRLLVRRQLPKLIFLNKHTWWIRRLHILCFFFFLYVCFLFYISFGELRFINAANWEIFDCRLDEIHTFQLVLSLH